MRAPNCATGPRWVSNGGSVIRRATRYGGQHSIVAQGRGGGNHALAGHGTGRPPPGRRLTRVGQYQPSCQLSRRFLGTRTVEGHQRRRHPGQAPQLGAPPVANRHDFNLIQAAADIVFETVNSHRRSINCSQDGSGDLTRTLRPVKRSGARRRRPHARGRRSSGNFRQEKSALSASAQLFHQSCTGFPQ
jgi:hypothetical protein